MNTIKTLIIRMALPLLITLAEELQKKDENSTGWDDETSEAILLAVEKLQKYGVI